MKRNRVLAALTVLSVLMLSIWAFTGSVGASNATNSAPQNQASPLYWST